jgi:hypothetical protein
LVQATLGDCFSQEIPGKIIQLQGLKATLEWDWAVVNSQGPGHAAPIEHQKNPDLSLATQLYTKEKPQMTLIYGRYIWNHALQIGHIGSPRLD